jgi:hypothetical protein
MLSILVYFYERLQNEYGGQLKNVKCETLERETEIFRNRQDTMNLFITELVVESPDYEEYYLVEEVGSRYFSWLQTRNRGIQMGRDELADDVHNSALQKYVIRRENKPPILRGIRILANSSELLTESEKYIGLTKLDVSKIKIDDNENWYLSPMSPCSVVDNSTDDTFLDEFKDDNFVKSRPNNKLEIDEETHKYISKMCEVNVYNINNLIDADD